jgi:hypothetical protein
VSITVLAEDDPLPLTPSALKDANGLNYDNLKKLITWDMLRVFVSILLNT